MLCDNVVSRASIRNRAASSNASTLGVDVLCRRIGNLYTHSRELLREVVGERDGSRLPRIAYNESCCTMALDELAREEVVCHLGPHTTQAYEADALVPLCAICGDLEES